jgi:hypothetical protein
MNLISFNGEFNRRHLKQYKEKEGSSEVRTENSDEGKEDDVK